MSDFDDSLDVCVNPASPPKLSSNLNVLQAANTSKNKPAVPLALTRRSVLAALTGLGVGTIAFRRALAQQADGADRLTPEMLKAAEWVSDAELSDEDRARVARGVESIRRSGKRLRETPVDADTVPALVFRPDFFYDQAAKATANASDQETVQTNASAKAAVRIASGDEWSEKSHWQSRSDEGQKPTSDDDLAFAGIAAQASWLQAGVITSRQLTELYLDRLQRYDPLLECVITLLSEYALEQADASDARRAEEKTLGILDGIPWVAKDLIAMPPWKTTWGCDAFRDQVRTETATVAERMQAAGAVPLAKVTLGALAWGDVWYGGKTRNPWNPKQGSSGSSAGSASAVAAGLASFALGSETLGSIVSPTRRCRTSGLRPTFGRVSRAGCMPLAWSMDKIGPIARHVMDLAIVFPYLLGSDGRDPTLVDRPFAWSADFSLNGLRVGITGERLNESESKARDALEAAGATLVEMSLDSELPVGAMNFILGTEAASVFEDAFLDDATADYGMWSNTFREARFTPAMQYLRANRLRGQLIVETERRLSQVDVVLGGNDLLLANLTGHPSIVATCGTIASDEFEMPGVIKMTAAAYREDVLLSVAHQLQQALPPGPQQPLLDLSQLERPPSPDWSKR